MANPLFNLLGGRGIPANGPMSNFANMIKQFEQFKSTFQGDPKQEVQNLLNSGKMTQEQFNQLQVVAKQFMSFLPN